MTDAGSGQSQRAHWESVLSRSSDRFGVEPSAPAVAAAEAFRAAGATRILELGAGQGRDTLFLAGTGFDVAALDYADSAVAEIESKATGRQLAPKIRAVSHDLRTPLPFVSESFDGCYSHMLYCMAFEERQLAHLSAEILRVLKSGGLNIYTTRTPEDPDYGKGIGLGSDAYELNGFVVRFLDEQAVQKLADGFELIDVEKFEEGTLPRKLVRVTQRKQQSA